jgi:hypothetical protein
MAGASTSRGAEETFMPDRPQRTGSFLVVVLCASLSACYTYPPEPAPPPPAAPPRALSITPQRRQSQRQQDRDKADCMSMANGQATSSTSWAQIFTACMGGRGYMVE